MRVQHTPARTLALKAVAFIGEFTGILAVENDYGLCVDCVWIVCAGQMHIHMTIFLHLIALTFIVNMYYPIALKLIETLIFVLTF